MAIAVTVFVLQGAHVRSAPAAGPPPSPSASECRSNPLEGVHDPQRLKILDSCAQIVGRLSRDPKLNPSDGDLTVNVAPDPGYESMLNDKNRAEGGLHVEVVPRDQPGCTPGQPVKGTEDNLGTCSGANITVPGKGTRVRVVGAHVLDLWVGWNEIHPAWRIEVLSSNPPPPPSPPTTTPAPRQTQLNVRLTGNAVVPRAGPPSGRASARMSIGEGRLCWTFSRLVSFGRPTKARIHRGVTREKGPAVLSLGRHFAPKGCVHASERVLEPIEEAPSGFYVIIATRRYPGGAVRGQLRGA